MNDILLVILWLVLTSCVLTGETLDGYVGQPYTSYVEKNGPSHQSTPIGNGFTAHAYENEVPSCSCVESCIITLEVNEAGIIEGHHSQGC